MDLTAARALDPDLDPDALTAGQHAELTAWQRLAAGRSLGTDVFLGEPTAALGGSPGSETRSGSRNGSQSVSTSARETLPLVADRPNWIAQANCRGVDPAVFYPGKGESHAAAKAVCDGCAVREQCLEYALGQGGYGDHGIWAGTSERERRRIRRERARARRAA